MAAADAIAALTPAWIASQRWFRAKARGIASVAPVDTIPLTDAAQLVIVEVGYTDGGSADRYLIPLAAGGEPREGDGAWRALVAAMGAGAELHGERGRLRCDATPALADLLPSAVEAAGALSERRLRVEQSNTSVVLGERLILKLVRLLEAGTSPDIEVGRFLGGVGFAETPLLAGSATYLPAGGEPCAAAILHAYVPSQGDAWAALGGLLATDTAAALDAAAEIGGLTRRLHEALASRPDDPAFPVRSATTAETAAWHAAAEGQLAAAVGELTGLGHRRMEAVADQVRARFADAFGRATGEASVSRIHGDYHLGQLLATQAGYLVIDFEGEPARPLAERRAPASPLRDVAGMLRSLDYAARTAERAGRGLRGWRNEARTAFLEAYGGIGASEAALVEAFELEKACYEVRYEANNRPGWLWLPLEAIEDLVGRAAVRRAPILHSQ